MSEHDLNQQLDYADKCAEEKYCSDNVPMICAFLNCDCDDCSKGKKEIAKRLIEKYASDEDNVRREKCLTTWFRYVNVDGLLNWLGKEE